mmetsp:Transcript_6094/g.6307  ORF Transcript_6094/g.6307 Transcript_6094/m.6307 type:complete len:119 (-) Transcript_6094:280-636(-)
MGIFRTILDKHDIPVSFKTEKIHATGLVVQDNSHHYSHWNASSSLGDWLIDEGIPRVSGIYTRASTKKIRRSGVMMGRIEVLDTLPLPNLRPCLIPTIAICLRRRWPTGRTTPSRFCR